LFSVFAVATKNYAIGFVNIFQQQDANHYYAVATVPTAPGARTSLSVPELHRFYIAVLHIANQQLEILVYQVAQ
jgi:hypothetical protein